MPKIKNWSRKDERNYDQRDFPHIWEHDEDSDRIVVIKKIHRVNRVEYDVYKTRLDSTDTDYIGENVKELSKAKKKATEWMRKNPY
jgi:hypothetical protein